jgi:hypothetical protein
MIALAAGEASLPVAPLSWVVLAVGVLTVVAWLASLFR